MKAGHTPVLVQEVLAYLQPRPGGVYLDCTVGGGGHAEAILQEAGETGRLVGLDRDPEALVVAAERLRPFGARVRLVHGDYRELSHLASVLNLTEVSGVLFDLGVSSLQLNDPSRGFSLTLEGPLDMRMDRSRGGPTARELLHQLSAEDLTEIIRRYGEERWARRIAGRIVEERKRRPLTTTRELAEVVAAVIPRRFWPRRIHPATRTFQALRIVVNQELEGLAGALEAAARLLRPEGRICVIAFHSLEDRVVKHLFRRLAAPGAIPGLRILTPRPITPRPAEVMQNPRSRSAKLRAAERRRGVDDL